MAFSENIVKNMANEIIRNCQMENVSPDYEFVVYVIQLMLYNPKFGSAGSTNIDRSHLENFVDECVKMLVSSDTPIYTLKIQFTVDSNYGMLMKLVDKHLDSMEQCLRPLVNEILDADPDGEAAFMKLYRKISIFIVLSSGLGNPAAVMTLKEGMSALESVFPVEDLKVFIDMPRQERLAQLRELIELVSGVRLFNRDCRKGGEGIPDLTFNIIDAGRACQAALSNTLMSVMQRVNSLTTAVGDAIVIQEETGNVIVQPPEKNTLTSDNYTRIFDLIIFYRQYEVVVRRLLTDVAAIAKSADVSVEKTRVVLEELHRAVEYKTAVPADIVYPLFKKLWAVWRAMQNIMYLLATIHRLMSSLSNIQDHIKVPFNLLEEMLVGKRVMIDQDRINCNVAINDRLCVGSLKNYAKEGEVAGERSFQFLGFCAICLNVGALMPSNCNVGLIKIEGRVYGFCSVHMAKRFSMEPLRYIHEVLDYARNNIHVINLLYLKDELSRVKEIKDLVTRVEPKIQVIDRNIQTDTHPHETYIDKNYSWDMWEWKRRACQWAKIVNCRTHSTQTRHSHMRSDVYCQTTEPRERAAQTKTDAAVSTDRVYSFVLGLRGSDEQTTHTLRVVDTDAQRISVNQFKVCPCTVDEGGDIDDKSYKIFKEINETSK